MIGGVNNIDVSRALGTSPAGKLASTGGTGASSFADALKKSIEEVTKLQQDASQAVEDLATNRTENVTGVLTAVEKSDLAFKTLLAIRAKLMDAYEEIKSIQV